jgi:RNA polymerase sigma factor (sigma-70 family)
LTPCIVIATDKKGGEGMAVQNSNERNFKEGNRDEWLEFIMNEYGERLTKLAYNYLKDWGMAQDVVQDVFITCLNQYNQAVKIVYLKSWIYRITINRCKDVLKSSFVKRYLFQNDLFKHLLNKDSLPEVNLFENDEKVQLSQKVLSLPIKYREVIILFYYEDLPITDIASLLAVNQNTLKTRLKRGRELLRKLWEERE